MSSYFAHQTVFITGGSVGIGRAVALECARRGARVALAARREDKLAEAKAVIEAEGGDVITCVCDVCDRASLDAAVAQTLDAFAHIDVVLANAGFGVTGPFTDLDTEAFRRQLEVNVFGVLNTIYATLPELIERKGRLGLLGSVMGRVGLPASAPYCVSKFAINGLAECLYYDLAALGVSVTLINPGLVESDIRRTDNRGVFKTERKDPAPSWLVCPTDKAARQMVRALHRRQFELVITKHGKMLGWFGRHFPRTYRHLVRFGAKRGANRG